MFQSFFESPEISTIFKRKETDKKIRERANARYDGQCVECLRLKVCKQLKKRDRNLKKAKSQTQYQHRAAKRTSKHVASMEDAEKIAMMNEDNVYYDYDEENGVIVEKKHSIVTPFKHISSYNSQRTCYEKNKYDSVILRGGTICSSCPEEGILTDNCTEEECIASCPEILESSCTGDKIPASSYARKQYLGVSCPEEKNFRGSCPVVYVTSCPEEQCVSGSCPEEQFTSRSCPEDQFISSSCPKNQFISSSCPENQFTSRSCPEDQFISSSCPEEQFISSSCPEKQFISSSCPENQFTSSSCPEDQFISSSCPKNQFISSSCPEEQFISSSCPEDQFPESSCPSDSAYDTTHDELTESLDRLNFGEETLRLDEKVLNFQEKNMKFKSTAKQDSPYRRCRSKAICGRNCKLCRGTNKNIIQTNDGRTAVGNVDTEKHTNRELNRQDSSEAEKGINNRDLKESKVTTSINGGLNFENMGKKRTKGTLGCDEVHTEACDDYQYRCDVTSGVDEQFDNVNLNSNGLEDLFVSGPHLMMLYDFKAEHEDDVTVRKGDIVLLLENCSRDWVWVMTQDYKEGYVPKSLTVHHVLDFQEYVIDKVQQQRIPEASKSNTIVRTASNRSQEKEAVAMTKHGVKIIAISSFDSSEKGKLCVTKGEEIIISLKDQRVPGWLWAYSPKHKSYGYIPEYLVQALEVSSV